VPIQTRITLFAALESPIALSGKIFSQSSTLAQERSKAKDKETLHANTLLISIPSEARIYKKERKKAFDFF
jgi:hypothetical protein